MRRRGDLYVKVNGSGHDLAESGDSGGPWFANTTALGTLSCQQGYDALYSTTGFVEHGSISILTAP